VETGGLTGDDLALALAAELAALCEQADGRAFAFRFHGDAEVSPDSYCTPLIEAGASRIVLTSAGGDHVLYDRVLEELVTVSGDGDKATIEVAGGRDQMTTLRALSLVLAQSTASLSGKDVTAHFPADLPASEFVEVLLATAKEFAFARMATHDGEVLWPPVLQSASKGRRTALRLREGMSPGLANSVRRALADISIEGQDVEFDWPSDSTPDADVTGLLVAANPASVVYTIGKEQDELVHPAPVSFQTEDDVLICGVDTSIGKPAVLVPAIERAMRAQSVAGQKVELHILGGGMLTRTMRAAMVNALLEGDAAQARLVEGDDSEFLFPALLDFEALDSGHVRLTVTVADRSPEEVASAFAGEFAASDLAQGATLRVADAMFVARLVEVGADRILLEGDTDVQAHPTLIRATSKDGDRILIDAAPDADDVQAQVDRELEAVLTGFGDLTSAEITVSWPGESDARAVMLERILAAGPALLSLDDAGEVTQLHPPTVRTCVDILGQREGGDLPMIMLGIDTGDDEAVSAALGELQERIQGRRVLVVYRTDGREVAGAADDAVVQATRAALGSAARAVLQFCPKTRAAPAHFEVVATNVEAVVLGSKVKDPRG